MARTNALLLLFAVVQTTALAAHVTPVEKVLQMLGDMEAKGKNDKHAEEVEFAKFAEWCDSVKKEMTKSIAEATDKIAQLEADIAKAESDAEVLTGEIADLQGVIATTEEELAAATAVREKEHAAYIAEHKDFSESIDACKRAIQVLNARTADVAQSLLQVQNSQKIPARVKATITSFLALQSGGQADGVPEANAYEFQSGGVIEMLEKLLADFNAQLLATEKAEISAKGNYDTLKQQLTDNIKADTHAVNSKTVAKAGRLEDAATAKGDLEITTKGKEEDEKTLSDTNSECHFKSEEYEKNQVVRHGEIVAIQKAIEIMSSDAVSGNADKHLPQLLQAKATVLAQLWTAVEQDPAVRQRAAAYLQAKAKKLNSRYLSLVAARVTEDPFKKIKTMIKDLIVKLMEEANQEADKNAYCTTELATNKETRTNKESEVEELSATADKLTADIAQLTEEIAALSDAMASISAQQAEATQIRDEEKATNTVAIADAKVGQEAVQRAIEVLRDFYNKAAAGEIALLQNREPYKGMQSTSGGVLGMLDVCLSDFARLETETSVAEQQAQTAYEQFMAESTEDSEVKGVEKEHKEGKRDTASELLRSTKKELELTQDELGKAMEYYEKLKADCLDAGFSYEDRKKAREEEIQSLKEALMILQGESLG